MQMLFTEDERRISMNDGIFAEKEIILTTSTEPNAVVSNILVKLTEQRRRRKRRGDCPYDLPPVARLTTQSPTFYLDNTTFSGAGLSSWLVTKTCVYAGYSEVLEIWLRNRDDVSKIYGYKNITIHSRPTPPNFLPPGNNGTIDISLCGLVGNLTIVSANKSGTCLSWSCSVRCMNSSDIFWVVDGITVMASDKYIQIGQTYELIVACNETASTLQGSIHESEETLIVRFSKNCPTNVSALTQILPSLRSTTVSTKSMTSVTKQVSNEIVHTVNMYTSARTALNRRTRFTASVSAQILSSLRSTIMSTKSTTSVTKQVSNMSAHTVSRLISARTELSRKTKFTASAELDTSPLTGITQTTTSDISKSYKKIAPSWTVTERTQGYSGSPVVPRCDLRKYKEFLDDPRTVAAVATTGGIILGIAMTIGYVIMSSRFKLCLCLPSMVSPVAEETQRRADFQIDSTPNLCRTADG